MLGYQLPWCTYPKAAATHKTKCSVKYSMVFNISSNIPCRLYSRIRHRFPDFVAQELSQTQTGIDDQNPNRHSAKEISGWSQYWYVKDQRCPATPIHWVLRNCMPVVNQLLQMGSEDCIFFSMKYWLAINHDLSSQWMCCSAMALFFYVSVPITKPCSL